MADQSRQVTRVKLHHDDQSTIFPASYSTVRQAGKYLTAGAICTGLLALSGLTLTGTVVALIMATPVLVLFSPVLVPAGIVLLLIAAGLVFSGGCGVAAVTLLTWIMYKVVSNYLAAAKKRGNAYRQFILV